MVLPSTHDPDFYLAGLKVLKPGVERPLYLHLGDSWPLIWSPGLAPPLIYLVTHVESLE